MEVSAKNGTNIKDFFKELAWEVTGGKKTAEKQQVKNVSANNRGVNGADGHVDLKKAVQSQEERKKRGCGC